MERKKILIRWKNNNKEQQENSISAKEIFCNDNIGNKLKIFLIFPYFDLSTILIMISFPHTLFPVGLWHCTIHDFSFLSFRSLLSFHTLIPGGPPLPCTLHDLYLLLFSSFQVHHFYQVTLDFFFLFLFPSSFTVSWDQAFPQLPKK